ncbi:MAG: hypothetical protein ACMUEM_01175 [Flavobacteriales bacterium AspAUS03]
MVSKITIFKARDDPRSKSKGPTKTLSIRSEYHAEIKVGKFAATEADFDIQDNASVILNVDKKLKGISK